MGGESGLSCGMAILSGFSFMLKLTAIYNEEGCVNCFFLDTPFLVTFVIKVYPNISFTLAEMARPSAFPANFLVATPITLPMS